MGNRLLLIFIFECFLLPQQAFAVIKHPDIIQVYDSLSARSYDLRLNRTKVSLRLKPAAVTGPHLILKDKIRRVDSNGVYLKNGTYVPFDKINSLHFKAYSRFQRDLNAAAGLAIFNLFLFSIFADSEIASETMLAIAVLLPVANIVAGSMRPTVTTMNITHFTFSQR